MNNKKSLSMLLLGICIGFTSNSFSMKRTRETFEQEYTEKEFDGKVKGENLTNENQEPIKRRKKESNSNINEENDSGLIDACKKESLHWVEIYLKRDADINEVDDNGDTPLIIACKKGNLELVKLLVEHSAIIDLKTLDKSEGQIDSPLAVACKKGHLEVANFLISEGADLNGGIWREHDSYNSPLVAACENGHLDTVKLLIKSGADIDEKDKEDVVWTPLYAACKNGHLNIVKFLISKKVDVNHSFHNHFPLMGACFNESIKIVKLLLENNANPNNGSDSHEDYYTPLIFACKIKNIELVSLLIKHEAGVNKCSENGQYTPLIMACKKKNIDLVKLLIKNKADVNLVYKGGKYTPLIKVCEKENIDLATFLIENEADVDLGSGDDKYTPLIMACEKKNIDLVKLLIENEADVDLGSGDNEYTPLIMACEKENIDLVKLLIKNKADVNLGSGDDEYTPLIMAFEKENIDLATFLIENEADVNLVPDNAKSTPLIMACEKENIDLVKLLIKNGADVNLIPDNAKSTPLIMACEKENIDLVKFLIENGADVNLTDKNGFTVLDVIIDINPCFFNYFNSLKLNLKCSKHTLNCIELLNSLKKIIDDRKKISKIIKNEDKEFLLKTEKNHINILNAYLFFTCTYLSISYEYIHKNTIRIYEKYKKLYNNSPNFLYTKAKETCYKDLNVKNHLIGITNLIKRTLKLLFEKTGGVLNCGQIKLANNKKVSFYPLNFILKVFESKFFKFIDNIKLKKVLVANIKEIIDLLMKNGSKVDFIDVDGRTPIFYTCSNNEMQRDVETGITYYKCLTEYLIKEYKAKVNIKDENGDSPLCYAINNGSRFSIDALLQAGAQTKNLNKQGYDFLYLLTQSKCARDNNLFEHYSKKKTFQDTFKLIKNKALKIKGSFFNKDKDCSICYSKFNEKEEKRALYVPCKHSYCLECIKKMFIDKGKLLCPTCNESNIPSSIKLKKKESHYDNLKHTLKKIVVNIFGFTKSLSEN